MSIRGSLPNPSRSITKLHRIAQTAVGLTLVAAIVVGCRSGGKRDDDDDDDDTGQKPAASAVAPASDTGSSSSIDRPGSQILATWTFDSAVVGQPPPDFSFGRTGSGPLGRWVVRTAPDAPSSPNILAQEDADPTDSRFALAVVTNSSFLNLSLSVRCKPIGGKVDRACGLVWRYVDSDNYFLARANALEDNVRLYYVKDGHRRQIAGWNGKVTSDVWHTLRVDVANDHHVVYWNGAKVIDAHDRTFSAPGRIGLWTKADSRTLFDDLRVSSPTP